MKFLLRNVDQLDMFHYACKESCVLFSNYLAIFILLDICIIGIFFLLLATDKVKLH